jgi:hypothetical protein
MAKGGGGGSGASRCTTLTLIGGSINGVEEHGEPHETCPRPPTSLYSAGDRGPPTIKGRAPPIRTQSRGRDRAVGLGHGEINLTIFSLRTCPITIYFWYMVNTDLFGILMYPL